MAMPPKQGHSARQGIQRDKTGHSEVGSALAAEVGPARLAERDAQQNASDIGP